MESVHSETEQRNSYSCLFCDKNDIMHRPTDCIYWSNCCSPPPRYWSLLCFIIFPFVGCSLSLQPVFRQGESQHGSRTRSVKELRSTINFILPLQSNINSYTVLANQFKAKQNYNEIIMLIVYCPSHGQTDKQTDRPTVLLSK